VWKAPHDAKLSFEILAEKPNKVVVGIDSYATEISIERVGYFNKIELACSDFTNAEGKPLKTWEGIKELRLDEEETLRPVRGSKAEPQKLGGPWKGKPPKFKNLCWVDM
jgi:hypothetical protein